MAIIYKDFTTFERISSIPSEQLDTLKSWADQNDLLFTEGTTPLMWPTILQQIREDFDGFLEGGGWKSIMADDSEEEQESEQDDDSEFVDEDASSQSSEDDSDFSGDDESESSQYQDDESDSEAVDWEELDKKAMEADRKYAKKDTRDTQKQKPSKRR